MHEERSSWHDGWHWQFVAEWKRHPEGQRVRRHSRHVSFTRRRRCVQPLIRRRHCCTGLAILRRTTQSYRLHSINFGFSAQLSHYLDICPSFCRPCVVIATLRVTLRHRHGNPNSDSELPMHALTAPALYITFALCANEHNSTIRHGLLHFGGCSVDGQSLNLCRQQYTYNQVRESINRNNVAEYKATQDLSALYDIQPGNDVHACLIQHLQSKERKQATTCFCVTKFTFSKTCFQIIDTLKVSNLTY